jgi:hypothetical protein
VITLDDPYDLSPVVNHLVTTVQDALAADQKIILMLGEEHATITHVHLAEQLRCGLANAGIRDVVMTVEQRHNLLEYCLPRLYPEESQATLCADAARTLPVIKAHDPTRYHHLQALCLAACNWPQGPVTRLENFTAWSDANVPVRLIDMARREGVYLDSTDPETNAFIATNPPESGSDSNNFPAQINAQKPEGMHLRNLWMAQTVNETHTHSHVAILQTGRCHLGGCEVDENPYAHSLHKIFTDAARQGKDGSTQKTRVFTVFPEGGMRTFSNHLSAEAQAAMHTPDTVILRGAGEMRHDQNASGSFRKEFATLARLGGMRITSMGDYRTTLAQNKETLTQELHAAIVQYAPALRLSA